MKNVLVVDAGLGNIGSVINAFERAGTHVITKGEPKEIESGSVSHIVLPGVGTYNQGMKSLRERGWYEWIKENAGMKNKPMLGICLGMQLMSDKGTEGNETNEDIVGLGLIGGRVEKICNNKVRLPHIGWNNVKWKSDNNGIINDTNRKDDYYFVHSYHFIAKNEESVIGTVEYDRQIVAAVKHKNTIGVQFHPEKSQKAGSELIKNFLDME